MTPEMERELRASRDRTKTNMGTVGTITWIVLSAYQVLTNYWPASTWLRLAIFVFVGAWVLSLSAIVPYAMFSFGERVVMRWERAGFAVGLLAWLCVPIWIIVIGGLAWGWFVASTR